MAFGPFAGAGAVSIIDGKPFDTSGGSGGGGSVEGRAGGDFTGKFEKLASCMATVLQAMQYRTFLSAVVAANADFFIDSPAVKTGAYWFVHALGVECIGGTGQSLGNILLMPPTLVGAGVNGTFGAPPKAFVTDGVRIDNQNAVTGGTVSGNPNGLAVARNFIVPPGWFIRFQGNQNATPGGVYAMKVMFAELPLDFDSLELFS